MRIIGGRFRGTKLAEVGEGDAAAHLRPTADRTREAVFNMLTQGRFGDRVTGARVLDLFAGTGAMGLEALSRGALRAAFVDDGAAALSGRRRVPLILRVKYEVPAEEHYLERLINEDAALLLLALKGPDYNLATSGILSVIPEEATAEPILDPTIEAHFLILSFPFDLLYLEA